MDDRFCRFCGYEFQKTIGSCLYCGKALTEGDKFCPYCGKKRILSVKFCPQCGKSVNDEKADSIMYTQFVEQRTSNTDSKICFPSMKSIYSTRTYQMMDIIVEDADRMSYEICDAFDLDISDAWLYKLLISIAMMFMVSRRGLFLDTARLSNIPSSKICEEIYTLNYGLLKRVYLRGLLSNTRTVREESEYSLAVMDGLSNYCMNANNEAQFLVLHNNHSLVMSKDEIDIVAYTLGIASSLWGTTPDANAVPENTQKIIQDDFYSIKAWQIPYIDNAKVLYKMLRHHLCILGNKYYGFDYEEIIHFRFDRFDSFGNPIQDICEI